MSIAALIRKMADAGAPVEAIALAVEAIEASEAADKARRAKDAERKARQRARERDSHGTVTGQSEDTPLSPLVPPALSPEPPNPPPYNPPNPGLLDGAGDAFERFRRAYPRRSGPWKPAREKFIRLLKAGEPADEIIRGAEEFARLKANEDPQFIPMPATWLNQERWKDPLDKPNQGPTNVRQFPRPDDGKAKFRDALARFRGEASGPSAAHEGAIDAEFKIIDSD